MTPAENLRAQLGSDGLLVMPCCFDALSAKLIEQAAFGLTFLSGFAASASRIGAPDLGLMSVTEMVDQARNINEAISIPMIGDGDTGHGNAMNVRRTVRQFAQAGCAGVMIEDQVAPKRCGHTPGKAVIGREQAFDRIRAAVDAKAARDIVIVARTDAREEHGLSEAIARAEGFHRLGADIIFIEAPRSEAEMRTICENTPGPQMANMLEGGHTPVLPQAELQQIGYRLAAYPLTLLSAAMKAMIGALAAIRADRPAEDALLSFEELRDRIGFTEYYAQADKYD